MDTKRILRAKKDKKWIKFMGLVFGAPMSVLSDCGFI